MSRPPSGTTDSDHPPRGTRPNPGAALLAGLLLITTGLILWEYRRLLGLAPILAAGFVLAWPLRRSGAARAVLGVLLLLSACWILHTLRVVVYPLVAALLLASWLEPSVSRLERRGVKRAVAAALSLLPLGAALVIAILVLIPTVVGQVQLMVDRAPHALSLLRAWSAPILDRFAGPAGGASGFADFLARGPGELLGRLQSLLRPAAEGAAGLTRGLGRAAEVLGQLFLTPVLTFAILLDWRRLTAGALDLVPPRARRHVSALGASIQKVMGLYLRGQLLVAAIEVVLYTVGFWIAGLDAPVSLGILAGFFSLVPVLGFWLTALVTLLSALVQDDPARALLGTLLVLAVVQGIENQLLVPRIQGSGLGLHPLAVLLGVLSLGVLFGVFGALLAVPLLGILNEMRPGLLRAWRSSRFYEPGANP